MSDIHNCDRRLPFDLNILRNAPIMPPHNVHTWGKYESMINVSMVNCYVRTIVS